MALYPSQEWCDEWKIAMNNDAAVAEHGKTWGTDFNGKFIFELQESGGLPKTTHVLLDPTGGTCHDSRILDGPESEEVGFLILGLYSDFRPVVAGDKDFIEGVVKGLFKVKGDMSKIMRGAKFIRAMANSISSFASEFHDE